MNDWSELAGLGPLLDAFPFQAWIRDAQGRCVWQNETARKLWGSQLGKAFDELELPAEMLQRMRVNHERAMTGQTIEVLNDPDDNSPHGGYLGFTAPLRKNGEIVGTTAVRFELAPRFAALKQGSEKASILEAVFQAARLSIGVREIRGDDVVHVLDNPVSAAQLGLTPEQTRGKTSRELGLPAPFVLKSIEKFRDSRNADAPVQVEVPYRSPDGALRTYLMHLVPVPTEEAERYLVLAEDVTETRQLEASLQQADRLISLGTLTASVGHEIKNPLSYLQMTLTMMRERIEREASEGAVDVPALRHDVAVALEGTERIVSLVRDLQSFSRPTAEEPGEADLNAVVRSILALASAELKSSSRVELALGTLPPVRGSPVRLGQVVLNLVLNANRAAHASASDEPGRVWIATRKINEEQVELVVGDNGPGISPEMRDRLFTPFASGHAESGGTGLGLYVVRQIVEAMKGEIAVRDRTGGGTEFAVRVPIAHSG
jgi:PAS domain S-box-containing protein